jgi:short-subunit dehydrogenase
VSSFAGKVVVITGAGSGIGRALAQQFAAKGARLALSGRSPASLAETLASLPAGVDARSYLVDVSDREAVYAHAEAVRRDFGTAHFVVNNAGANLSGTIVHMSIDEIEWQLAVNLWSVIYGTKAFLPMLLAQREGCIVNVGSVLGLVGFPTEGAYNMSKFAVRAFTECLWSELDGTGVRAVSVLPGFVRTNIGKAARRCAEWGPEEARVGGIAMRLMTTSPEKCAADIVAGIERGKKRILTGNLAFRLDWLSRLLPSAYPAVLKPLLNSHDRSRRATGRGKSS